MLKLENLKKRYKDFELNCTMEVQPGCVTGIIGVNGAGKSTVFKAILGLIRYDEGKIEILGKPIDKFGSKDREEIGVVLPDAGFSDYLTIQDIVPVLRSMYTRFDEKDFLDRCENFRLPMNKRIKEFSTGMKRKLQVLAAISHNARFLLLDEPTAGLDVIARDELLGILREYMETEDRSVLISSHISGDLENFCDDIYLIDNGKIILHEETDVLLGNYAILKATEEQYEKLDKKYLFRHRKEAYGYSCLTNQKQFYMENYPEVTAEKGNIDEVIMMMGRGEA